MHRLFFEAHDILLLSRVYLSNGESLKLLLLIGVNCCVNCNNPKCAVEARMRRRKELLVEGRGVTALWRLASGGSNASD